MPKIPSINADDVWAAACAAQRVNNEYVKYSLPSAVHPGAKRANRDIVYSLLKSPELITNEDREEGKTVRRYYQALMFKFIGDTFVNSFEQTAMKIANRDYVVGDDFSISVIASLPGSYKRNSVRDKNENRIKFANGGLIGSVGDKLTLNVEVLKCFWSNKWQVFFITTITDQDQLVSFAYGSALENNSKLEVTGKVKKYYTKVTQLTRVKVNPVVDN